MLAVLLLLVIISNNCPQFTQLLWVCWSFSYPLSISHPCWPWSSRCYCYFWEVYENNLSLAPLILMTRKHSFEWAGEFVRMSENFEDQSGLEYNYMCRKCSTKERMDGARKSFWVRDFIKGRRMERKRGRVSCVKLTSKCRYVFTCPLSLHSEYSSLWSWHGLSVVSFIPKKVKMTQTSHTRLFAYLSPSSCVPVCLSHRSKNIFRRCVCVCVISIGYTLFCLDPTKYMLVNDQVFCCQLQDHFE